MSFQGFDEYTNAGITMSLFRLLENPRMWTNEDRFELLDEIVRRVEEGKS